MALIRFKKKQEDIEEQDTDNEKVTHSYEQSDFEKSIHHFRKKQQRMTWIKRGLLGFVLFIMFLGTIKGFTIQDKSNEHQATALQSQTFIKRYVQHYFNYPKSEADSKFLTTFTLEKIGNAQLQANGIKQSTIEGVEIYGVKQNGVQFTYYLRGILKTITQEEKPKEEKKQLFFTINTMQVENKYLVTTPIFLEYAKTEAISKDEYALQLKEIEKQSPKWTAGKSISQEEIKELTTSMKLFFETWSKDVNQAAILTQEITLYPLSEQTSITLQGIENVEANEKEIRFTANTTLKLNAYMTQQKYFQMIVDKTTNKIKQIKEE